MIRLDGCRPTPLSSYMAGMGVFRLTAEQKDPGVRASWERDRLVLETGLTKDKLVDFLLHGYEPSPVISPWSYDKYGQCVGRAEPIIGLDRMRRYREAVESTELILRAFCESEGLREVTKDDIKAAKAKFIRMCRNMWPDGAVEWLDAAVILTDGKPSFSPLFGTGGNEGNFDIPENFAERLRRVFADDHGASAGWLDAVLFGGDAALDNLSTSGHNPHGSGRPNSGQSYDGTDVSNPWEHILMVEGMLMFAGGVSRRTSKRTAQRSGWSAFPFVSDATKAGYATAADEKDRGEVWLPIWGRPASYGETLLVLREGRASYGGRNARTGTDFALAASRLGVERGIGEFCRFAVLERKGESMITVSAGRMPVRDVPDAVLVDDIRQWKDMMRRFVQGAKSPPHAIKAAVRLLDERILSMCSDPGPPATQALLVALGWLERAVSGRTWSDRDGVAPFPGSLSVGWLRAADDGSAEFRLAAAAASVGAGGANPIRGNLEEVKREKGRWAADRGSASCAWRDGSTLYDNLGRICVRRVMEAKSAGSDASPLCGMVAADLGDVDEFLVGVLDARKIADLLLPLSMVRMDSHIHDVGHAETAIPAPAAYALLKSVYDTPGVLDMVPLSLLAAGRAVDALESTRRRARASGMLDGTGVVIGGPPECVAERLLGSLAFPVGRADRAGLLDAAALREPPDT